MGAIIPMMGIGEIRELNFVPRTTRILERVF
jgi:hypothetical protein